MTCVMGNIVKIKEQFDTVSALYSFVKLAAVKEIYNGGSLKRVIETRCSGHLQAAKTINENYDNIIKTLPLAGKNNKLSAGDRALACGLLVQSESDEFVYLDHLVLTILKNCDVANKILQSSKENLTSALNLAACVRKEIQSMRETYDDIKIAEIISEAKARSSTTSSDVRTCSIPSHLEDYVITEHLPIYHHAELRRITAECIDKMEEEFSRRFSDENTKLWALMEALLPNSKYFMDVEDLYPIFQYAVNILTIKQKFISESLGKGDFEAECRIFRRIHLKEDLSSFMHDTRGKEVDMCKLCVFMDKNHVNNASILTFLYKLAVTAGYGSARVECLFSTLTKVDTPQRRRMTTERESNLTFLHFERKTLGIDFLNEIQK